MKLFTRMFESLGRSKEDAAKDALATLVLAAREDAAFRDRVLVVLKLPPTHRESLVRSAVEEMQRRGEPAEICAAFLTLATRAGAEIAARAIGGEGRGGSRAGPTRR